MTNESLRSTVTALATSLVRHLLVPPVASTWPAEQMDTATGRQLPYEQAQESQGQPAATCLLGSLNTGLLSSVDPEVGGNL